MNRKAEIHAAYEHLGTHAAHYDGMMTGTSVFGCLALRFLWQFSKEEYASYMAHLLASVPHDFAGSLLEVPVGTGSLTMPLYQTLPRAKITCLDYSGKMLDVARKLAGEMNLSNVVLQQGDVGALPFGDGTFNHVLTVNGLHAFPHKDAALDEMCRVLAPGGIFSGSCYVRGERSVTDIFVRTFCTWRGFFTPPYDTADSLRSRLAARYESVHLHTIGSFAEFICKKNEESFDSSALSFHPKRNCKPYRRKV